MSDATRDEAAVRDRADPLAPWREAFALPANEDGVPLTYLCGHSLGLMPHATPPAVTRELADWARWGVEGHFHAATPWYDYHMRCRETAARLVGAEPGEVVMMNSLTANLHLMLVSFYRPRGRRRVILMEAGAFPSDRYAVESHVAARGGDPARDIRTIAPRPGEAWIDPGALEAMLDERGEEIALLLLGGVHYVTGQCHPMGRLAAAAHRVGALVGYDLAHAAGNVPLALHAWGVDFAVWCSYKYLNAGPGAVAGCFVHERHGADPSVPRFAGWWGTDPATRFAMEDGVPFTPVPGADGWQLSNPPILALAPLRVSLNLFDQVGMEALRAKSERLTGWLWDLLQDLPAPARWLTPADPVARGCQLSLQVPDRADALFAALRAEGIVADLRRPDVVRFAPVPFYNSFTDVWRTARAVRRALGAG